MGDIAQNAKWNFVRDNNFTSDSYVGKYITKERRKGNWKVRKDLKGDLNLAASFESWVMAPHPRCSACE